MEKGNKVYVKREKIYGENKNRYEEGEIERKYSHHILVKFELKNGRKLQGEFLRI